jgi:hypothetical protein
MPILATRTSRWLLGTAVVGLIATGGAATYAYKTFFQRPGEGALRLMPAETMMVATVDLSPSPAQTLLFKRIDDALARNDMADALQGSIIDLIADNAAGKAIRGYAQRSGAIAILPEAVKGQGPRIVGFIGLTDPEAVRAALRKHAPASFWRGTQSFRLGRAHASVIENYLVLCDDAKTAHEIERVSEGAPSLLQNASFVSARKEVDADANLMVMISPAFLEMATAAEEGGQGISAFGLPAGTKVMTDWMAISLALRDNGLALVANGKIDGKEIPGYLKFAAAPLLRPDLFQVLPRGAYGFYAASAPAALYDWIDEVFAKDKGYREGRDGFAEEMKANTDLDLQTDVIGNLRGTTVFAAYPSADGKGGLDLLALMDDREGSKPAAAVRKLVESANRESTKGGGPAMFAQSEVDGAILYSLDGEAQEGFSEIFQPGEDGMIKGDVLGQDKTLVIALVGDSILVSTNRDLLKRGIAALKSHSNPIAEDEAFASLKNVPQEAQHAIAFHLGRIAEGVASTLDLEKMDAKGKQQVEDIVGMFRSMKEPMVMTALSRSYGYKSVFFMPMDYDKLIDLIGKEMRGAQP